MMYQLLGLLIEGVYLLQPGYLSRCCDWLWAGRSGDRIPVGARGFSTTVQTVAGSTHLPIYWIPAFFPGDEAAGA